MGVLLRNDHPQINIDSEDINKKIEMVMSNLDCFNQEVSILLTADADIRELNQQFRNIDQATDVLSFPQNAEEDPPIPGEIVLGDIAVSLDTAQAQAKEHGLTFEEEIILLLIHGILHLLGYDHINNEDAEHMESIEINILKHLGYQNPYELSA
jgi:probable rRNA maturation factor